MSEPTYSFHDTSLSIADRVDDLVARMTLEEKVSQMLHESVAIPRLGVPAYNWWNECLHGVARAGVATVFPQAIGLAASWNPDLLLSIAEVVSTEARAKHHEFVRQGDRAIYKGLTFWSPNVNIFRDPRWGRGQETYGEDPYLTARMGTAYVRGLQGDNPTYLKVAACAKHYAVHSGPENDRHHFDARVSQRELWDTYLPAFEALVRAVNVEIVMGAYNRTNGEACCASPTLLQRILRERWGFDGHVTSDCWAIIDLYQHHKIVETRESGAAIAVENGCDLNCGCTYDALVGAVAQGLITEATIDESVKRLMRTRMRLGMFDPQEQVAYAQIPYEINDSADHRALALRAALESMVLLKNADNILPLDSAVRTIAVIGPNADDKEVLWGNYNGIASQTVTPLQGIRKRVSADTVVRYTPGCDLLDSSTEGYAEALAVAARADVVIFIGGISQRVEGEEKMFEGAVEEGDRTDIQMPPVQLELLKRLHALGKPVVLVVINGGPISLTWEDANLAAILEAWYPGEEGGAAIAQVLFGDYNPAGRLPITVYRSLDDIPDFRDYATAGRTYRYFTGTPLYRFGYGLSYTQFAYSNLYLSSAQLDLDVSLTATVTVTNIGPRDGDEVVQLYVRDVEASVPVACHSLQGLQRVHLKAGERRTVTFTLDPRQFFIVDDSGQRVLEPGMFKVFVGGGQPADDNECLVSSLVYAGKPVAVDHLYGDYRIT